MLRADTQALWQRLAGEPLLAGFVLVGGSALAMHLGHRISEDLDFVYVGMGGAVPTHLPTERLEGVYGRLRTAGVVVADATRPGDLDEFELAGLNLAEHQQTLTAGTVSLSFFMPDEPLRRALRPGQEGRPRVADLDELFASKALVAASRSKTRDWFDLYHLMRVGGYTIDDFVAAFERCSTPAHLKHTGGVGAHVGQWDGTHPVVARLVSRQSRFGSQTRQSPQLLPVPGWGDRSTPSAHGGNKSDCTQRSQRNRNYPVSVRSLAVCTGNKFSQLPPLPVFLARSCCLECRRTLELSE